MMILRALLQELDRNLELARSTRNLLTGKRDMLQGDVKKRLILHQFHTDIWDALVRSGHLEQIEDVKAVATCYERLNETNELIRKFDEEGNAIIHSPLINREGHDYGREHVIEIMTELCEETESVLHDAYAAIDNQIVRTCLTCGELFESKDQRIEHVHQVHESGTQSIS